MNITTELTRLEVKRNKMHDYLQLKLESRDYHAVADAAMDLRELESRITTLKEVEDHKGDLKSDNKLQFYAFYAGYDYGFSRAETGNKNRNPDFAWNTWKVEVKE